ncbi:hypothetical protein D030_4016 [Vibrio parahaemolyticus AQ3810]|nr:hypothetical protein D030_4016 [Vibrio parahaemolyticus AQ3810]
MPFCIKLLLISISSRARKPPLRAASAISTIFAMRSSGSSALNMNALPAIFAAPKNWPSVNFINTTNAEPPTTIRIDVTSTNMPILPPSTIAMMTKAKPPIKPIRVAKSTKHSSRYLNTAVRRIITCIDN